MNEDSDRPDANDPGRADYEFRRAVIAHQQITSPFFGRHLGAVMVGDSLSDYEGHQPVDLVDERLVQASQQLLDAMRPIHVGRDMDTPDVAFGGTQQDAVGLGPMPDLPPLPTIEVGSDLAPDFSPPKNATMAFFDMPQVSVGEDSGAQASPLEPRFPRESVVEPMPPRPEALDNPLQPEPFMAPRPESLDNPSQPEPFFLQKPPGRYSGDLTLGVSPPEPPMEEQATGTVIVNREPAHAWGQDGPTVEQPWGEATRTGYEMRMDAEDSMTDYDRNLIDLLSMMAERQRQAAAAFRKTYDSLASEGRDTI